MEPVADPENRRGTNTEPDTFDALERIVARLRSPNGCPWDRAQTHDSIKRYLLEEAYEVIQALDEKDAGKLCEELGDLLLQIMLHAQIAAEAGEFQMKDVIRGIATKLIRRHPHVFGNSVANSAEQVAHNWEEIKQEEREKGASILSSVPKDLPALAYSHSIQRRAAGVGFDWHDFQGILDKLTEEVGELHGAEDHQHRLHEMGDVLFALVNAARWMEIDLEEALRLANARFYRRFAYMEELCLQRGLRLGDLSLDEQNRLWEEAKRALQ